MRNPLLDMSSVTERQKNMSLSIKNGIVHLGASVDVLDSMLGLWKASLRRLTLTEEKQRQTPLPPTESATPGGGNKRPAHSPPDAQQMEKRQHVKSRTPPTVRSEKDGEEAPLHMLMERATPRPSPRSRGGGFWRRPKPRRNGKRRKTRLPRLPAGIRRSRRRLGPGRPGTKWS